MLKTDTGLLRVKREDGTRAASVRDFHSFRVTWVTLALKAGVCAVIHCGSFMPSSENGDSSTEQAALAREAAVFESSQNNPLRK